MAYSESEYFSNLGRCFIEKWAESGDWWIPDGHEYNYGPSYVDGRPNENVFVVRDLDGNEVFIAEKDRKTGDIKTTINRRGSWETVLYRNLVEPERR